MPSKVLHGMIMKKKHVVSEDKGSYLSKIDK